MVKCVICEQDLWLEFDDITAYSDGTWAHDDCERWVWQWAQ